MNKLNTIIIVLVIVIFGGWYLFSSKSEKAVPQSSPLNATYLMEERPVALVNGKAEIEVAPGSATKNMVSVFGEPVYGDIDKDGDDDAILILVNESGGSGTFYYVAISANVDGEYKGTDAILLGDRILVESLKIEDSRAKVNYLVRAQDEPFTTEPSVKKALHLQFDAETLRLVEVAVNFEGEANPDTMKLDMKTWKWIKTSYSNDTEILPKNADAFTISFKNDGTFSATTDCNSMNGTYKVVDKQITFGENIAKTKKFCEGSQEQEFAEQFGKIQSYFFTSRGELVFDLKFDSGSAIFR